MRHRLRYARHLLLPEVGSAGQAKLCERTVAIAGDPQAMSVAGTYLERAGLRVDTTSGAVGISVVQAFSADEVRALAGRESLRPAAAFLAGAFSAVEEIKRVLGVGAPGTLDGVRLTGAPKDHR